MNPEQALPTICLITPPSIFLLDERVFVNLGILKIAAVLERAGYPVEMLDLSGIENYQDAVRHHVRQPVNLLRRFGRRLDFNPATDAVEDGH